MADSITATPDAAQAAVMVVVHIDSTAGSGVTMLATVERSADGGTTWTTVPNGVLVPLVGTTSDQGDAYVWDHGAPLNTTLIYRATTTPVEVVVQSLPVFALTSTAGWLKDPARPWANIELDLCPTVAACVADDEPAVALVADGLGTESYASDATLFPVLNRRRPGEVYAVRKDAVTSARFVSRTLPSAAAMNTLFAWGGPIFLQFAPEFPGEQTGVHEYGWCDRYYQPGTVSASRISRDLRKPYRLWDASLTVVDPQVGPVQGTVENNWCAVAGVLPRWEDIAASGLTWANIVAGAASPQPSTQEGYGFGPYGSGPYGDGG